MKESVVAIIRHVDTANNCRVVLHKLGLDDCAPVLKSELE